MSAFYTIRYQIGTYSGTKVVRASDADEALAKARRLLRSQTVLAMAAESYRVERVEAMTP